MIKICITILVVYLLYYAGNIVYDLFLKKETVVKDDEGEEFALETFAEMNTNEITEVSIDDVEHLNTPNSFLKKELFPPTEIEPDESRDLDYYKKKFESEEEIDAFENQTETEGHAEEENIKNTQKTNYSATISENDENVQAKLKKEDTSLKLKKKFNQFLNLAETQVQVLSDRDGFKVYHSMI